MGNAWLVECPISVKSRQTINHIILLLFKKGLVIVDFQSMLTVNSDSFDNSKIEF